jgi:predicted RNA binding protein YcfA (HicA-like mRNA interferase family)
MRQYTQREFIKIVARNGFHYDRHHGDHAIYINDEGRHISIPKNLECVIALRLIKENNLNINIKKGRKQKKKNLL